GRVGGGGAGGARGGQARESVERERQAIGGRAREGVGERGRGGGARGRGIADLRRVGHVVVVASVRRHQFLVVLVAAGDARCSAHVGRFVVTYRGSYTRRRAGSAI